MVVVDVSVVVEGNGVVYNPEAVHTNKIKNTYVHHNPLGIDHILSHQIVLRDVLEDVDLEGCRNARCSRLYTTSLLIHSSRES